MSILYLAALASAVTLVPTASNEPKRVHAKYGDLDLSTLAGRETLDRRVKLAVAMVCGPRFGRPVYIRKSFSKCRRQAMVDVEPQRVIAIAKSGVKLVRNP